MFLLVIGSGRPFLGKSNSLCLGQRQQRQSPISHLSREPQPDLWQSKFPEITHLCLCFIGWINNLRQRISLFRFYYGQVSETNVERNKYPIPYSHHPLHVHLHIGDTHVPPQYHATSLFQTVLLSPFKSSGFSQILPMTSKSSSEPNSIKLCH